MKKNVFSLLFGLFFSVTFANQAFAQEVNDIGIAMTDSMSSLPGFVAAFAYLGGLIMAVSAIFKTIDHVTNPNQTPLSTPVIRFLLGGALFALPIIAEAASTTISGGTVTVFSPSADAVTILNGMIGGLSALISFGTNANAIMESMMGSVEFMPGLIAAVSYLLGLVIAVSALYKTRDHVEDPNRVPLKDSVIRYITAGALFALPTVFEAMYETIVGSGMGIVGTFFGLLSGLGFFYSSEPGLMGYSKST